MLKLFRRFSFKPETPLKFTDGKHKLLEARGVNTACRNVYLGTGAGAGYFLYRILRYYSEMSWLSFSFQGVIALGLWKLFKDLVPLTEKMVYEINLLENGKEIELGITGAYTINKTETIRISDIVNPEDNQNQKLLMMHLNSWTVITRTGQMYLVSPTSTILEKEVMQNVFKGIPIDVSGSDEASNQDEEIIDI